MLKNLLFCAFLCFCIAFLCTQVCALDISAKNAVLIECESGDIIFSKNAFSRASMASTTKIMTAIVAIEKGNLDKVIEISCDAIGIEGSSIYLKEGEQLTLRELLFALLLESANDAAIAIALAVGGSVENFVQMMNDKVCELSLENTHFTNPHGLDNENHYTTAYDLAQIARYAMQNPCFCEVVSSKKQIIPSLDGERVLINHNKLLKSYDGAIGIKTGFTKKSGRCLVSCAERDGVKLIAVTLNAPSDWNDHTLMLDLGFDKYEHLSLAEAGDYILRLHCVGAKKDEINCGNLSSLGITLKKGDAERIVASFEGQRFLYAPIKQGECVGKIVYSLDGRRIASLDIYALESASAIQNKKSIFERIFKRHGKDQTSKIFH